MAHRASPHPGEVAGRAQARQVPRRGGDSAPTSVSPPESATNIVRLMATQSSEPQSALCRPQLLLEDLLSELPAWARRWLRRVKD